MSNEDELNSEKDLDVLEAKPKLAKPRMYQVYLLNDDFTPMDFVIDVLSIFFLMPSDKATKVMLQVHTEGRGVCGIYTADVAQTKVKLVNEYAKIHQHPLLCLTEQMD